MSHVWYIAADAPCSACQHQPDKVRIGGSSAGWEFDFDRTPDDGPATLDAWRPFLQGKTIIDDYGRPYGEDEFISWVLGKQGLRKNPCKDHHDFDELIKYCRDCGISMEEIVDDIYGRGLVPLHD